MSTFKAIRQGLGVSTAEMSRALGMSSPNVSYLDRGQTVTPETARKLIEFAATLGVELSYDQIYGAAPLPPPRISEPANRAA